MMRDLGLCLFKSQYVALQSDLNIFTHFSFRTPLLLKTYVNVNATQTPGSRVSLVLWESRRRLISKIICCVIFLLDFTYILLCGPLNYCFIHMPSYTCIF